MDGAESGAESGTFGDFNAVDGTVEDVGHDLQDGEIHGATAGGVDGCRLDLHPRRVDAHRHHLRFHDGAAVLSCGVLFVEVEAVNAGPADARDDLRFKPRQHDRATIARFGVEEQLVVAFPIEAVLVANSFASQ